MTPTTEEELADFIAGTKEKLRIVGGGTRQILGNVVDANETLKTSKLTGIELYEPGALTIVANAGTPLFEIEKVLKENDQRLAFEPMDHRSLLKSAGKPTIGSVAACNISGSRRIQTGACRDSMIGIRFVDGSGNIIKNGGRVMKNVTGYDLVKLISGSFGTLGVITQVGFKLLPAAEAESSIVLHGLSEQEGIAACTKALASPNDVSGVAHIPSKADSRTIVRIDGFAKSVAYRTEQLKSKFKNYEISVERDKSKSDLIWKDVSNASSIEGNDGDIWRVSVKPTDGPKLVEILRKTAPDLNVMYDWAGGLVWIRIAQGTNVRELIQGFSGHATQITGKKSGWGAFHPQNPVVSKIEKELRAKFDPRGILNPGLMG